MTDVYRPDGDMHYVSISEEEAERAWARGYDLRRTAAAHGAVEYVDDGEKGDRVQSLGCLGEAIAAEGLGLPPDLLDGVYKREADLAHNIEVRVMEKEWFGLRVYPNDPPDRRVVGVIIPKGDDPRGNRPGPYRMPGWCYAGEAQNGPENWNWLASFNGKRSVIAVPQSHLRSIPGELLPLIASEMSQSKERTT